MSFIITENEVTYFCIKETCIPTFPCKHRCEIQFKNSIRKELEISNPDISTLIRKIGYQRTYFESNSIDDEKTIREHFYDSPDIHEGIVAQIYQDIYVPEILEDIITFANGAS